MSDDVPRRRVNQLLARRRDNIDDSHIDRHDYVNDDGEKIEKVKQPGPGGSTKEVEFNLTRLFRVGPSTTSNHEIIRIEAELAAEGQGGENPHIPANDEVLETALERLEQEGLTPAWEAVDGPEVTEW